MPDFAIGALKISLSFAIIVICYSSEKTRRLQISYCPCLLFFRPITKVQFYVLLFSMYPVLNSYYMLFVIFVMFNREKCWDGPPFTTCSISNRVRTDYYLQRVTNFGLPGLVFFFNQNFDTMLHDHQAYIIPLIPNGLSDSIHEQIGHFASWHGSTFATLPYPCFTRISP